MRDGLPRRAERLGFVGLVRLLERLSPAAARVGGLGPVSEETLRFRHEATLTFQPRDVSRVELRAAAWNEETLTRPPPVVEVTAAFLGLTGTVSPLPGYLAEEVAQEDPDRPAKREFLDLFHHRLLSLFYRAVSRGDGPSEHTSDLKDRWSQRAFALMGLDAFSPALFPSLPPEGLLRLSPVLSRRARGAAALRQALEVFLGPALGKARVEVREFVGAWAELEAQARFLLGQANHGLGRATVLGRSVFEKAGAVEISLGPADAALYRGLQAGGPLVQTLHQVVGLILRDPLDYRVVVRLAPEDVPALKLGTAEAARLGRTSWVGRSQREVPVVVHAGPAPRANELQRPFFAA